MEISKFYSRFQLQTHHIAYALSETEKALAISLRTSSWASMDDIWESLLLINPKISRISVYRCFVKEKINRIPEQNKEKAKQFKEYEPGYLHIDVTYLPKFDGKANYLFVAIDRCTRAMIYWVYEHKTAANTEDFMAKCLDFFPFHITHILTDLLHLLLQKPMEWLKESMGLLKIIPY